MAAPYTNIKFSDAAMPRIAQATGYSNPNYNKAGFQQFLAQNPDAKAKYDQFQQQAVGTMMASRGGVVKFVDGGMVSKKFDAGGDVADQPKIGAVKPGQDGDPDYYWSGSNWSTNKPVTETPTPVTAPTATQPIITAPAATATAPAATAPAATAPAATQPIITAPAATAPAPAPDVIIEPENPDTFVNPATLEFGHTGPNYTYTRASSAAQARSIEAYLTNTPEGPYAEYYRSWMKNHDKAYNPDRQEGIVGDKYVSFDYSTYPPTKVETGPDFDELKRIGDTKENERTPEDVEKLSRLRKIIPLTLDDGTTVSATNARARYDQIAIKREDTITDDDRAFAKQFRAQYGFVPIPDNANVGSPEIVDRTTAMMEGLTQDGQPILTEGMTVDAFGVQQKGEQDVAAGTGQIGDVATVSTDTATGDTASDITATDAVTMDAVGTQDGVSGALAGLDAAQTDTDASVTGVEQYDTNVSGIKAAQGEGIAIDNTITREIENGELVNGVANADKASEFAERIQAATATPTEKATVQGQLEKLYSDFDAAEPPPWASGAMRAANAAMAARGLSASSLAGQAVVQASMEAAIPIAQADASVFASFEQTNLSNRQQRAMLAAQQRATFIGQEFDQAFQARVSNAAKISDVANMNFNAEQQIQLENSRIANTVNLQNLSNRQAKVLAEAAALANLETASLNNRQAAAVQTAQNLLQQDLSNLSNRQQTSIFKSQQSIQSMFTDAAAENAARQFNATSENQTTQFFANLSSTTDQFNVSQNNALEQFNTGQVNASRQFNANVQNQRDQFNAQNAVVIAQSNAQWRRQIATADTASLNRANELNARSTLELSTLAYNNTWQLYKDIFEFAFQAEEGRLDRENALSRAEIQAEAGGGSGSAFGSIAGSIVGGIASSVFSDIRLKKNIEPVLDYGNGIKMYKWEWRDKAKDLQINKRQNRGFIAQNVLKYFPDLVRKDEEAGYLRVDYLGVVKKCMA